MGSCGRRMYPSVHRYEGSSPPMGESYLVSTELFHRLTTKYLNYRFNSAVEHWAQAEHVRGPVSEDQHYITSKASEWISKQTNKQMEFPFPHQGGIWCTWIPVSVASDKIYNLPSTEKKCMGKWMKDTRVLLASTRRGWMRRADVESNSLAMFLSVGGVPPSAPPPLTWQQRGSRRIPSGIWLHAPFNTDTGETEAEKRQGWGKPSLQSKLLFFHCHILSSEGTASLFNDLWSSWNSFTW